MSSRITRSKSRTTTQVPPPQPDPARNEQQLGLVGDVPQPAVVSEAFPIPTILQSITWTYFWLPSVQLSRKHTALSAADHTLLLLKQQKLQHLNLPATHAQQERYINRSSFTKRKCTSNANVPRIISDTTLRQAISSTLIFASESAGTAVCIDESGLILTCAHCVAESSAELTRNVVKRKRTFWLLMALGHAIQARMVAWDEHRDLALLQIVATQAPPPLIPAISISGKTPETGDSLICIGQPGSEDLEVEEAGFKTGYPILAISQGRSLGMADGQDVQDNSEIGALLHDAWTYWGHSGAPLVDGDAMLVGLYSSWDDETGIRRGVGVEAIQGFLREVSGRVSKSGEVIVL